MHSDEVDFILGGPRSLAPDILFCPTATWIADSETLIFLAAPTPVYDPYRHIIWVIEDGDHWIQAECYKNTHQAVLYITAPHTAHERLQPLIQQVRQTLGYNEATFAVHAIQQQHPTGMCGQQLIFKMGIHLPTLAIQQQAELQTGPHSAPVAHITQQAVERWHRANAPPAPSDFALHARHWFLLRVTGTNFLTPLQRPISCIATTSQRQWQSVCWRGRGHFGAE